MLVKKIVTIFKDFPKKHAAAIAFGLLMLLSISILGNFDLSNQKKDTDLSKKLQIDILKQETQFEPIFFAKETTIKRNDSLFNILTKFGVKNENIIDLINTKNSNLLSSIEVGDKIRVNVDEDNEIKDLIYIDDFQSGVRAERFGNTYKINKFKQPLEKVKIFKHVVIEDSMYVSGLKEGIPSIWHVVVYINSFF